MVSEIDNDAQDDCFFIFDMAMPAFVNTTGMSTKPVWELLLLSPSSMAADAMAAVNLAVSVELACCAWTAALS